MAMVVKSETITDPYLHAYESHRVADELLVASRKLAAGWKPNEPIDSFILVERPFVNESFQLLTWMQAPHYVLKQFRRMAIVDGTADLLTRQYLRDTFYAMTEITNLRFANHPEEVDELTGIQVMVHAHISFLKRYYEMNLK
jgi:hypothetical protein